MDLDDKLAEAFAAWSVCRDELGRLRQQLGAGGHGRTLAPSPEAAALFERIGAKEAECDSAFALLAAVAEERAAEREARQASQQQASGGTPEA